MKTILIVALVVVSAVFIYHIKVQMPVMLEKAAKECK